MLVSAITSPILQWWKLFLYRTKLLHRYFLRRWKIRVQMTGNTKEEEVEVEVEVEGGGEKKKTLQYLHWMSGKRGILAGEVLQQLTIRATLPAMKILHGSFRTSLIWKTLMWVTTTLLNWPFVSLTGPLFWLAHQSSNSLVLMCWDHSNRNGYNERTMIVHCCLGTGGAWNRGSGYQNEYVWLWKARR